LAFVLAALVNSTVHELAHAIAGLAQGKAATLTPFSVGYDFEGTVSQQATVTAAGPLFSLVLGLGLMVLGRSMGKGLLRLFVLWLSFISAMNFVGYLVIAPFAGVGDTGRLLELLQAPGWVYVVLAVVGVAGQFGLAYLFAGQVRRYTTTLTEERQLAFYPWIFGTAIVMVLTLMEVLAFGVEPAVMIVVVSYSFAVAIFAPMQFIFHERFRALGEPLALRPFHVAGFVGTAALAAGLVVLAAVGGVTLG
jgi:hypothetical protein